jgi:hypothetical protein
LAAEAAWLETKRTPLCCGGSSPMAIGPDHLARHDLLANVLCAEGSSLKKLSNVGLPD